MASIFQNPIYLLSPFPWCTLNFNSKPTTISLSGLTKVVVLSVSILPSLPLAVPLPTTILFAESELSLVSTSTFSCGLGKTVVSNVELL